MTWGILRLLVAMDPYAKVGPWPQAWLVRRERFTKNSLSALVWSPLIFDDFLLTLVATPVAWGHVSLTWLIDTAVAMPLSWASMQKRVSHMTFKLDSIKYLTVKKLFESLSHKV
ncbi:hypothetical protein TNCV_1653181 [Trichonephila clavipes]|nr:hypothetical protein TNCV_1653181 [Trichonephila clavipes]